MGVITKAQQTITETIIAAATITAGTTRMIVTKKTTDETMDLTVLIRRDMNMERMDPDETIADPAVITEVLTAVTTETEDEAAQEIMVAMDETKRSPRMKKLIQIDRATEAAVHRN